MLPDHLRRYLDEVESAIRELKGVHVERCEGEVLGDDRAKLPHRLRFARGLLLEISEAIVARTGALQNLGYRYHFQNQQNELVFRFENMSHCPDLGHVLHHTHLKPRVLDCEMPSHFQVLEEAARHAER